MARTQVQAELIATNAISGTIIADNAITATHIATNSISGVLVQDSGIVTTMIAANNVTAAKIVSNGVLTRHISDDQVTGDKIASATIVSGNIANNAILTQHIDDDQITTDQIAANTIATANIADNAVDGTKIASNSILTRHIDDNQVGIDQLNVSDGSSGQMLTTNGSGTLSFSTPSSFDADAAQVFNESGNDVDFRVESNGNANMLFVDGGNDNILIGTQDQGHMRLNQQLGFAVSGNEYGGMSFVTHSATGTGNRALLDFNRSRNTTIGSHTVVVNGDSLGTVVFRGDDGDEFLDACYIQAEVDGTPGNGDMPGRLCFFTTPDGASSSTEKMRIGSTGKTSWSAGGIGAVATQSRDFTFYTEGSTNGVDIRSNDYQIAFIGAAGSSGAGMDKGYMQLCLDGGAKVAFNTDGDSYFNGGKLAIGADHADEPLTVRSSGENVNTYLIEIGNDLHATNTKDAWIKYVGGAATTDHSWATGILSDIFRIVQLGARATTPDSGTQRMHILADGEVVFNSAIADTYAPLVNGVTGDAMVVGRHSTSGSLGLWRTNTMEFKYYHNGQGYIMTFGSNGVLSGDFNDTSDVNLKENISSISDGTTVIKALRPVKFDWKASGKGNNQHGFIAQEVETVLPDAVTGNNYVENKTGLPEDEPAGNGKTMNSNAVLAHAVKAIQELEARIKTLEDA